MSEDTNILATSTEKPAVRTKKKKEAAPMKKVDATIAEVKSRLADARALSEKVFDDVITFVKKHKKLLIVGVTLYAVWTWLFSEEESEE
jgi:hypothetical protein